MEPEWQREELDHERSTLERKEGKEIEMIWTRNNNNKYLIKLLVQEMG